MKIKELFQKTLKNYIGITEYVANVAKCARTNNFNIFGDIMKMQVDTKLIIFKRFQGILH